MRHKAAAIRSATVSDTRTPITIPSPIKNSINPRTFFISYSIRSLWFTIFYAKPCPLSTAKRATGYADLLFLRFCSFCAIASTRCKAVYKIRNHIQNLVDRILVLDVYQSG